MPVEVQIDERLAAGATVDRLSLDRVVDCVARISGDERARCEMCIRICDAPESRELNATYRNKDKPTNVLSFSADPNLPMPAPLGDLAICWPVVLDEAAAQSKEISHHLCHLIVHGMLHLLGHDHVEDDAAQEMERLEVAVLRELGIENPYFIVE